MLRSVLSPDTCADCRNCCIFEVQSAWELPTFSAEAVALLQDPEAYEINKEGARYRITLPYDGTGAAQRCPFLDPQSGCTLPASAKPFACSLWPVRLMRDADGRPAPAVYQGCPGMPDSAITALKALLRSGLLSRALAEAELDPSLILPYHPNYRFLFDI